MSVETTPTKFDWKAFLDWADQVLKKEGFKKKPNIVDYSDKNRFPHGKCIHQEVVGNHITNVFEDGYEEYVEEN